MKPVVSIIIVNYNGGRLLADCVDHVRRHSHDYEILLIDNCSSDGSVDALEKGSDLRIIRLPRNVGFARANNIGIGETNARHIVLLNSDTKVSPLWLERLIERAESSCDIGIVAPKLLLWDSPTMLDSTGHIYLYETGNVVHRGSDQVDQGQYDNSTELLSCPFSCALIKRVVFERIGLLDEAMFFYFEDVDFALRARIAGWRVVYCPRSVVYHLRRGSTPAGLRECVEESAQQYPLRIMLKNYQFANMLRYAGRRFLLDIVSIAAGMKNFDTDYARRHWRDISWNIAHFPLRERIMNMRLRRVPDKIIFRPRKPMRGSRVV